MVHSANQPQDPSDRLTFEDDRKGLGRYGEELAARHLATRGYRILARNWRCSSGEVDLVAQDGACLVLVEVRARRGDALGSAEESVTPAKQARLLALAEAYVQANDWHGDYRIDVVAIEFDRRGRMERLEHYEDAIRG